MLFEDILYQHPIYFFIIILCYILLFMLYFLCYMSDYLLNLPFKLLALIDKMLTTTRVTFRATRTHNFLEVSDILIKVTLKMAVHNCSISFALLQMLTLTEARF